ncbi:type I methionyl aminopeptidase [Echinimonas agarilytica]|uniref:Methionine aminopeptidase n=1 Tax=Echinimonas agarilytica TaxID=1215918 RepID=A0AA41W5V7_9GAMM|nr:type I methionyl aminopeptidase [Echinimonas agarilytica]MCM2679123.1 type I methionyl aminopeptidase [Echinimonas agarilytica]
MSITIKTPEQIEKMRIAGRLAADVLEMIAPHVKSGVSTGELDRICHNYIVDVQGAVPAPLNYHGFPKSICTSINEVVCHGIPDDNRILKDGDCVNIDITVIKDGFHGDTSKMFFVGEVSAADRRLASVTQESLYEAIRKVRAGARFDDIGNTIDKYIKSKKQGAVRYTIVQEYCGHGIGEVFHEDPQIVHYKHKDGRKMEAGMCFTIEPMINSGKRYTELDDDDGWTVYTKDRKNSAQWEHTLLVTKTGCEILTLRSDETIDRVLHNN